MYTPGCCTRTKTDSVSVNHTGSCVARLRSNRGISSCNPVHTHTHTHTQLHNTSRSDNQARKSAAKSLRATSFSEMHTHTQPLADTHTCSGPERCVSKNLFAYLYAAVPLGYLTHKRWHTRGHTYAHVHIHATAPSLARVSLFVSPPPSHLNADSL